MNLLPADIILIRRGTLWMPAAPLIWIWQRIADPTTPWSWAYHVEMVWRSTRDGYMAFSLQPPVLDIVHRKFADLHLTAYRLKNRPDDMDDQFWRWGNDKILRTIYVLGWQTCGHPIVNFYGMSCPPYPGSIEAYCKTNDKFVRLTI